MYISTPIGGAYAAGQTIRINQMIKGKTFFFKLIKEYKNGEERGKVVFSNVDPLTMKNLFLLWEQLETYGHFLIASNYTYKFFAFKENKKTVRPIYKNFNRLLKIIIKKHMNTVTIKQEIGKNYKLLKMFSTVNIGYVSRKKMDKFYTLTIAKDIITKKEINPLDVINTLFLPWSKDSLPGFDKILHEINLNKKVLKEIKFFLKDKSEIKSINKVKEMFIKLKIEIGTFCFSNIKIMLKKFGKELQT